MLAETKQVLVLGGGYAGVMAALRLAGKTRRQPVTVTLVNGLDYFVERPRLHEQTTGTVLPRRSLVEMLRGSGARFRQGWVTAIDRTQRRVRLQTTEGTTELAYDTLVYALGSRVERASIPGIQTYAYALDPHGDLSAAALRTQLEAIDPGGGRVVVVGGGATGVEVAPQIKAIYPQLQVTLVTTGQVGGFKGPQVRRRIVDSLTAQGIDLRERRRVTAVEAGRVMLEDGHVPADLVVWAGGFVAPPLARDAGLRVNHRNQVLVDPYLRSVTDPAIYAIGDAAQPVEEPGVPIRMAVMPAVVGGAQAADNLIAALRGKTLRPLSFVWYGQGIALGPHDAVGFPTYPDDAAGRFILRGRVAVGVRSFFLDLLRFTLELERRLPGAFTWNGKGRFTRRQHRTQRAVEFPSPH